MAKISEETRNEVAAAIQPYKDKITSLLEKEKNDVAAFPGMTETEVAVKKFSLCEDMIFIASLYIAQNSLSVKMMEVKNNDALNDARKLLYKAIIYLEEIVTNITDIQYSELSPNHEKIQQIEVKKRYAVICKLGLMITMLKDAFGDNSKWKESFVELEGRFATVAKNLIDMKLAAKEYFDPHSPNYETTVLYVRMIIKMLDKSSVAYRDRYELSTRRLDDMRTAIKYVLALRKLYIVLGDSAQAEECKTKALVWKNKMDADSKKGISK